MTHGLDIIAALKRSRVALIDGSLGAHGGRDSVGAGDSVVGAGDPDGTGKGGEGKGEDDGDEETNEHLELSS